MPRLSRNRIRIVIAALLSATILTSACRDSGVGPAQAQLTKVGMAHRAYFDPKRMSWSGDGQRPLSTTIWYPAAEGGEGIRIGFPSPDDPAFVGGVVQPDAAPRKEPAPLIVLSHGTGGSALQMMWLGRRLADAGFMVAAVDHHGNTGAEEKPDPRGFRMIWERARDLSAVIDSVLADPQFGPLVDEERIAVAGFSLGGYTVLAVAGAVLDIGRFRAFCAGPDADPTCGDQPEFREATDRFEAMLAKDPALAARAMADAGANYRDPRVRAVFALAPAPGSALDPASLAAIEIPVYILAGDADVTAPIATNAQVLADAIPGARFEPVPGVGHYVFLDVCTEKGNQYGPLCIDGEGIDREQVHQGAAVRVIAFFQDSLGFTPE